MALFILRDGCDRSDESDARAATGTTAPALKYEQILAAVLIDLLVLHSPRVALVAKYEQTFYGDRQQYRPAKISWFILQIHFMLVEIWNSGNTPTPLLFTHCLALHSVFILKNIVGVPLADVVAALSPSLYLRRHAVCTAVAIDIDFSHRPVDIYPDHHAPPRSGTIIN